MPWTWPRSSAAAQSWGVDTRQIRRYEAGQQQPVLSVAVAIANIWARDPFTMTAAQLTLAEAYPDRFLLGLGVSHARLVEGLCGHQYERPLTAMRRYLDAMDKAAEAYRAVKPGERPARVLAALGPSLAAEGADGAHPVIRRLVQQTSACGSGTHLRILPGQPINGS